MDANSLEGREMNRRFSVAPMMDWTDRHDRYFLRLISRRALLYTEMVTSGAILHGDRERFLAFDSAEHPVALQLGGSEPDDLARCAAYAEQYGYDEVNLNVGCPSDRVQRGRFGACLMQEPDLVANCVRAMRGATGLPVTVKTRIGVDERDSFEELCDFVSKVSAAGCRSFTIHARKAWLQGLSPKENREIPPLRYDVVYNLKRQFRDLEIVLNGGVMDLDAAEGHLRQVDGVMIGRAAYQAPFLLADVDRRFFRDSTLPPSRAEVLQSYQEYAARQMDQGVPLKALTRHILGLFNGMPGARAWRRHLSENAHLPGTGPEVIEQGFALVADAQRQAAA